MVGIWRAPAGCPLNFVAFSCKRNEQTVARKFEDIGYLFIWIDLFIIYLLPSQTRQSLSSNESFGATATY